MAHAPASSSHPPALLLDNQLCFALYSASLTMTKVYKPLLEAIGLTYPQYLVMLVLWERDGLPLKDIGERLFLDSGTLTPLLKRLETAGRIHRARDPGDERQVIITLTEEGKALGRTAKSISTDILRATGLDGKVAGRLRSDLIQLRRGLGA